MYRFSRCVACSGENCPLLDDKRERERERFIVSDVVYEQLVANIVSTET